MVGALGGSWVWVGRLIGVALVLLAVVGFVRYMTAMPGRSHRGPLAPLGEREQALRDELRTHVEMLAGTIGERNMARMRALNVAADFLRQTFAAMGYEVREQAFRVAGEEVRNLEVELRGHAKPEEIVVIGAHYDSVYGSPGANDNASGVAALVALARAARGKEFARTVRFVAFVNEEPPYFQRGAMGSQHYAREAKRRGEKIVAMMSLETIGCYSDAPGSQSYPAPFSFFYPTTGNFLGFVGNLGSRRLVRQAIGAFRETTPFPSEGVAAPTVIPGIGWSDQWSFWEEGYDGIMVTDTALFRYAEYHTARDRPEILDYERLARVVAALERVLAAVASSN
ncbi:MAG: M28 family peptidase [Burkholderiales bacterium]